MKFARLVVYATLCLGLCIGAKAQLLSTSGQETTPPFTPPTAFLAVNQPATTFALTTGSNTFLLSVNPTSTIRVSIVNETSNPCIGAFTIAIAASNQNSTSFNNQLQQWSSIPLITSSGALTAVVAVDIPALSTIYVSSTAISARNVAIQVVNTTGGCTTTSIDITATVTAVSVTSPLVSNTVNGFSGGLLGNVQGIIPSGNNGTPVFPVVAGSLSPSTNTGLTAVGFDTSSAFTTPVGSGISGNFQFSSLPTQTKSGELAIAFMGPAQGSGSTAVNSPWSALDAPTNGIGLAVLNPIPVNGSNALALNFQNSTANNVAFNYLIFSQVAGGIIRQHLRINSSTPAFGSNTASGSTLAVGIICLTSPCSVASVTDTQGGVYKQVAATVAGASGAVISWVNSTPSTAAADTLTITMASGVLTQSDIVEISGLTPSTANQASAPLLSDANKVLATGGNLPGITDPCQATGALKSHAFATITTATTTALITPVAGTVVYVCEADLGITGTTTAGTIFFEQGTGVACVTGPTALTATYTDAGATITDIFTHIGSGGATAFRTATGGGVCAVTTVGTAPSIPVDITYVQN